MLFAQIIHIIIGLFIFMLVIRMFVTPRDAYFNPLFGSIHKATEPFMRPVHKALRRGPRSMDRTDMTVLIPILSLALLDGLLFGLLVPDLGLLTGLLYRVMNFADYVFLAFVVLILVFSAFYKYARYPNNPFLRAGFKMMEPAYVGVGKLGKFFRKYSGITLFFIGLAAHILAAALFLPIILRGLTGVLLTAPKYVAIIAAHHSLFTLLSLAVFFTYVIIAAALMSWLSPDPNNPVVQLLRLMSEPINAQFRRFIPLIGGIDISPIFSILALQIIARFGAQMINALATPAMAPIMPQGGILL